MPVSFRCDLLTKELRKLLEDVLRIAGEPGDRVLQLRTLLEVVKPTP